MNPLCGVPNCGTLSKLSARGDGVGRNGGGAFGRLEFELGQLGDGNSVMAKRAASGVERLCEPFVSLELLLIKIGFLLYVGEGDGVEFGPLLSLCNGVSLELGRIHAGKGPVF